MSQGTSARRLEDAEARRRISQDTDATLFVNAGAGSGKTTALVERVRTLVLRGPDPVPLRSVAAVTFTEKAGAELRDRLRAAFEAAARDADDDARCAWAGVSPEELRGRAQAALEDLDSAPIGTLHAFAQRILTEHAIEAGLPPLVEVLDEVGSSVAFEERWSALQTALLDDDEVADPLLLGLAAGVRLDDLRSLARALGSDWDLVADRVLAGSAPPVLLPDTGPVVAAARAAVAMCDHCTNRDNRLLPKLVRLEAAADAIERAPDDGGRLAALFELAKLGGWGVGRKADWAVPIDYVRAAAVEATTQARTLVDSVVAACLRNLAHWVAVRVLDAAEERRREGRLEFHDLLVLARRLLRERGDVRQALHERYRRLLLDEFQDTDPIQIELATRIAAGERGGQARWQDVPVPEGRLFVVGDAKQSIYKFRRASIDTYLQAQSALGERVSLTTNFRTVDPVLEWVNAVFAGLITEQQGQPSYEPLATHRGALPDAAGAAVTLLGSDAHADKPDATALREREAADVAAVVRRAKADRWQVRDSHGWRDLEYGDVAVLVPARTSLPQLEDALDAAGVPYRAEASSLVYQADEVRALLACARAVADPSDELGLVTALRSPLFACGDDDLWRWKHAGGRLNLWSTLEGTTAPGVDDGPVAAALDWLRGLHRRSRWATPSELLGWIVAERRMLEVAAGDARARDVWRRLRFVVDQARAWAEVSHGGLRAYLAWAAHQGRETTRVAESVLPETDVDAVRVMTVHAAKGLEFPMVVLSGMTAQRRQPSGVRLLWPAQGGYEVKVAKDVATENFEVQAPVDEQMDELERIRLLYVAATRARDHLVVSMHRTDGSNANTAASLFVGAGAGTHGEERFSAVHGDGDGVLGDSGSPATPTQTPPPPSYEEWHAGMTVAREASERAAAVSASGLEGTEPAVVLGGDVPALPGSAGTAEIATATDDEVDAGVTPGLAKGARNLELPPWSKGRYGSAVGRAVHAVLQSLDLTSGAGLDEAVAAQAVAEGVVGTEALVADLVRSALTSERVRAAAAREHWRETYVGTVGDDGAVLEGYVDLIYRDDDGTLVVVDYKTDAVPPGAYPSRLAYYAPQLRAYARCVRDATGADVRALLLFLHPQNAVEVEVPLR